MTTSKTRQEVYDKFDGHCAYCGERIPICKMQVDHIIPQSLLHEGIIPENRIEVINKCWNQTYEITGIVKELNEINNLMPSCRKCNFYKSSFTISTFRNNMKTIHERLRKPFIFKLAEKYGIVEVKEWDGLFYFEKLKEEVGIDKTY